MTAGSTRSFPRPRALVFDLDGTLVDSREDIAAACNAALAAVGRAGLPLPALLPMIGDGARSLVVRALAAADAPRDEAVVADALDAFRDYYLAHPCTATRLLPGAERALGTGLPTALVTNKLRDVADRVLQGLGIADRFRAVRGGGDVPLKPAPDGVAAVLAELGVAAGDAWMIGDGPQDVFAGRHAGCVTVAVPGIAERARVVAAAPDIVARDLDEVCDLISPPA